MFQNERNYEPAVEALKPALHNLPGKIVAITGLPGVGKTSLGRYLAYRFNVSLIETDLFLRRACGAMEHHEGSIDQVIGTRLDQEDPERQRPVVIEGATVLRLLDRLGRRPDVIIQVINGDAPASNPRLAKELESYEAEYTSASAADLILDFSAS